MTLFRYLISTVATKSLNTSLKKRIELMKPIALALMLTVLSGTNAAAQKVVNVYSARHYDTDDQIYRQFEKETGIKVNLIEGGSDSLLARLKREGRRSPADVFITVDAGRLYKAEQQGVFQSVK